MILDHRAAIPAVLPAGPPLLAVVVDTEEEFDWARPHDRSATAVTNLRHQGRAHRVFERHGIRPTYVIDYPVASLPDGYLPLRDLLGSGACDVGAHLHPWVNPPHEEPVTYRNSYPGNLPEELERRKLAALTEAIAANLGTRPTIYRAGRYGVGPATGTTLEALGYAIDSSVVPGVDLGADEGPDFTLCPDRPYWFGRGRPLLEIPLSHGYIGPLGPAAKRWRDVVHGPVARALKLPGVLARGRLAESFRLTPEGIDAKAMVRLTRALLRQGPRVFVLSYHSPSLDPGHTPYVRSRADLAAFLDRMDHFFDVFMGELGGRPATLAEIRAMVEPPATG